MQVLGSAMVLVNPSLFRKINRAFANGYWSCLVFVFEKLNKMDIEIIGDDIPQSENAVVDCNHQSMADTPILMSLAWRKRRLGDLKFFAKEVIKYIPGPGWGMVFLDCIFVKRNWMSDKANIDATFQRLRVNKVPVWIVSFLEGTRITPDKLKRSQRFMKRRNLPITNNVMAPRTKGFQASVSGMREQLDAAYNVTIFYPEGIPTLWQLVRGDCSRVTVHVRRTCINDIPIETSLFEKWVIDAYVYKDQLLERLKGQVVDNKRDRRSKVLQEAPTN